MDDLFSNCNWHSMGGDQRALVTARAEATTISVSHFVRGVAASAPERTLGKPLTAAFEALDLLKAHGIDDLARPEAVDARDAIAKLVRHLESRGLTDVSPDTRALVDLVRSPEGLLKAVRRTVNKAFMGALKGLHDRATTFSFILFTEEAHGGAIARSLEEETFRWHRVIEPRDGGRDEHIAIIVDPRAGRVVRQLAQSLGVLDHLPCVVFMGDAPDALDAPSFMVRLGARALTKDADYPDQLEAIYKTAYAESGKMRGEPFASAFDRLYTPITGIISPKAWVRLIAGLFGGEPLSKAVAEIEKTLK